MKIKGTALITTVDYVTRTFGEASCEEWLSQLDKETEYALRYPLASSWYPVEQMYLVPGIEACRRFTTTTLESAVRQWGAHGAERELSGVYRVLLKIGSPGMMVSAASKTWRTYYSEGKLRILDNRKGFALLRTEDVPIETPLWGEVTAGWMARALQLTNASDPSVVVSRTSKEEDSGENCFEFVLSWQ